MSENTTTDIALLPPADRALIVLNSTKTEADLKAMVEEAATITEIKDKTGREQAHRVGMKLKSARTTIQKTGKSARDDATAFCKAVIDEEKRLIAITEGEEKRVIGLRDAFDEKLEAERRAEEARRAEIKEKIEGIRRLPLELAGLSAFEIEAEMQALAAFTPPVEVFGDLTNECHSALAEAVEKLADLHARVLAQETAAAAIEAERRRIEESLAAERAALEAERAKLAAERAELEALRAQAGISVAPAGPETEPFFMEVAPEPFAELLGDGQSAPDDAPLIQGEIGVLDAELTIVESTDEPEFVTPTDWRIRNFALHTAGQFEALAAKVSQCGFASFAGELAAVAIGLRNGDHDAALTKADHEALIAADNLLLDATVEAIDTLRDQDQLAA